MLRRRKENTVFAELLREQVVISQLATKSCFQYVNEIQKLRGHELEEIDIDNSPECRKPAFVLTVAWVLRTHRNTFSSSLDMNHGGK